MRKFLAIVLLCALGWSVDAIYPVRNLRAVDYDLRREVISDVWQNRASRVLFEWDEPYAYSEEVKEYRYYFGPNIEGVLVEKTTELSVITDAITEGVYYFKIEAVDVNDQVSRPRVFILKYDATPYLGDFAAKAYSDTTKQNPINDGATLQEVLAPLISFDVEPQQGSGAPLKGVNFYLGTNPNGKPDRQVMGDYVYPKTLEAGNYYLRAALEDEAGNLTEVKTLLSFKSEAVRQNAAGRPALAVLGRQATVQNSDPLDNQIYPGTIVHYTISLVNSGSAPALNLEIKDLIPEGTSVIPESLSASLPVITEYFDTTINGGSGAWVTQVTQQSNISEVRWTFIEGVPPQSTDSNIVNMEYSVVVNLRN